MYVFYLYHHKIKFGKNITAIPLLWRKIKKSEQEEGELVQPCTRLVGSRTTSFFGKIVGQPLSRHLLPAHDSGILRLSINQGTSGDVPTKLWKHSLGRAL